MLNPLSPPCPPWLPVHLPFLGNLTVMHLDALAYVVLLSGVCRVSCISGVLAFIGFGKFWPLFFRYSSYPSMSLLSCDSRHAGARLMQSLQAPNVVFIFSSLSSTSLWIDSTAVPWSEFHGLSLRMASPAISRTQRNLHFIISRIPI